MYKLKQKPEDFIVKENIKLDFGPEKYSYFLLKKKDLTTHRAIKLISQKLHLNLKDIGYAGLKDKHAITYQYISIKGNHPNLSINEPDIELTYKGTGPEPITLGSLSENYFEITIRDIEKKPKLISSFPNYFDKQRFSKNNAEIGKLLIKKEFKEATFLLKENKHPKLSQALEKNPTDYVGAINRIPRKILMLYLHSYQSKLFNYSLNNYIRENFPHKTKNFGFGELSFTKHYEELFLELPGFDSEQENLPDDILPRDFIIRQLPNLSLESQKRPAFVKPTNIKLSDLEADELNKGKNKIKITFSLKKGSYATMFIKALFSF
jgi:tRNA pseudouridine13 synthase